MSVKFIPDPNNGLLPTLEYQSDYTNYEFDFENVPQEWRDYIKAAYAAAKPIKNADGRFCMSPVYQGNAPNVPFPFLRGDSYKLKLAMRDAQNRTIRAEYSLTPANIAASPSYELKIQPRQWFLYSYDPKGPRNLAAIPLKLEIERLRDDAAPITEFKAELDDAAVNEARRWGYNGLETCVQRLVTRINEALEALKVSANKNEALEEVSANKNADKFELVVNDFYFQASAYELKRLQEEYKRRLNEPQQALEIKLRLVASCNPVANDGAQPQPQPAAQPANGGGGFLHGIFGGSKVQTPPATPNNATPNAATPNDATPNDVSATFKICFMPQEKIAGIIALDLGFSASTAALWHPAFQSESHTPNSKAQLAAYRDNLLKLFKTAQPFDDGAAFWDSFCVRLASNLGVDGGNNMSGTKAREGIVDRLELCDVQNDAYGDFYNFLRLMENALYAQKTNNAQGAEYSRLRRRLSKIYRDALKVFSFERHSVELPVFDGDNQLTSEFRLTNAEFLPQGEMGAAVRNERVQNTTLADEENSNFYRFPKRKLATIYRDAESRKVFQGALATLYKKALTEFYNHIAFRNDVCVDYAPKVIVLYPATLAGDARRELTQLAREMGGAEVISKYDESIAPLIFYLTKLMGNFDEIGPEAFKAKCRRATYDDASREWFHNMLIVDVGMGTTDVSLIRLKMTEQEPTAGARLGGRVYKIEPMLLGSMGYEDVSGNTFTKKIFQSLKTLIAEVVRPGCFANVKSEEDRQKIAGSIVPTVFSGKTGQAQKEAMELFSFLWNLAEKIKIDFSEKHASGEPVPPLDLFNFEPGARDRLKNFFNGQVNWDNHLYFPNEEFIKAQNTTVATIEERARTLAVVALNQAYKSERARTGADGNRTFDGVDSIILSGRSSKLPEIRRKFKQSVADYSVVSNAGDRPFAHPFTEITFEPEYAKTATVVGALLTEKIFQDAWANLVNTPIQCGLCGKDVDVDNLFFNVSANFIANNQTPIFNLQEELYFCDFTRTPRRQSGYGRNFAEKFGGATNLVTVERSIGDTGNRDFAGFNLRDVTTKLWRVNPNANVYVQYEITYDLILYALFARTNAGDVGYTDRLEGLAEPVVIPIPKAAFNRDQNGRITLVRDIVWSDQPTNGTTYRLFQAGVTIDRPFHTSYPDDKNLKDLKYCYFDGENSLSAQTRAGDIVFFLSPTQQGQGPENLGVFNLLNLKIDAEIKQYIRDNQNSPNPRYRLNMTLAVDEQGNSGALILFVGDDHPPYWETDNFNEWLKPENQGMVYRENINTKHTPSDVNNPFNGTL